VSQDTFYPPESLRTFASRCLQAAGAPVADADTVAENLTDAHLRGVDSHGVTRLIKIYVERLEAGIVNPRPQPRIVHEAPGMALVDADNGLGAVAGSYAMRVCLEKARGAGTAWVGVHNSNHFGACAFYTNRIAAEGMVGIALTNAPATMAPWGGIEPYLGTNPIGFSVPTRDGTPISVDMATSVAARGYILLAAAKGEPIPAGWAQDKRGQPTTDAKEALEGTVLPMAGHKGYALALMIDLLSGVLTGAGFGRLIGQLYGDFQHPQNVGHLIGAIDIQHFLPLDQFYDRIDRMAAEIRSIPRAEGVARIFLPGDIEAAKAEQRQREGIPVAEPIRQQLAELGRRLGVPFGEQTVR
jgi:LDH2 family malate/lactate/ureidoglycolate dehydrogenase